MSKSLPQLSPITTVLDTDVYHVNRSNIDYKITGLNLKSALIPTLTGYVSGAGTIVDTDTVLQAIQKLNGNNATNWKINGNTLGNDTSWIGSSDNKDFLVKTNNTTVAFFSKLGTVSIGTSTPLGAKLEVLSTTEQFRAAYDASNYVKTTVSSNGLTTFEAVGSGAALKFNNNEIFTGRYFKYLTNNNNYIDFGANNGTWVRSNVEVALIAPLVYMQPSAGDYYIKLDSSTARFVGIRGDTLNFIQSANGNGSVFNITHDVSDNTVGYINSNLGTSYLGIGTNTPDKRAVLDLTSTTQGFLAPRLTNTQRNTLLTFATGTVTIVDYTQLSGDTVTINGIVLTEGIQWTAATSNNATATSLASAITTATGTTLTTGSATTNIVTIIANSAGTGGNTIALVVSDGTNSPASGSSLTGGKTPPESLMIYNKTTEIFEFYKLSTNAWTAI